MVKVLFVSTISNTIEAFLVSHIEMLLDAGCQVDFACHVRKPVSESLLSRGCQLFDLPFERSPLSLNNRRAYKQLKNIIAKGGYDIVHTHTPVASACSRLACRSSNQTRIIYTAHGFHFFKGAPLLNWMMYYPVEKWLSRYTDTLITINQEDYERAKSNFRAKTVVYVPGVGMNWDKFADTEVDKPAKRKELGVPEEAILLLSVGELNRNKNHEAVIRAIARLQIPQLQYVVCGVGSLECYLKELTEKLHVDQQVHFVGYRTDIGEICKSADMFIFPSLREGLPVSLMEAMCAGLPCIASDIRGNVDLIEHGQGGYLFPPKDVDILMELIHTLSADNAPKEAMGQYNMQAVKSFDLDRVLEEMTRIYFCHNP